MYWQADDPIVAIATAAGRGGVGIVRVSGRLSAIKQIAENIAGGLPCPRKAKYAEFVSQNKEIIDSGLIIYFNSPASFTGEDVLEFHGHGSPVALDWLVQECANLGARLAEPGEFSKRAYLNNKLDLTQAEAISDLINSATVTQAKLAKRTLIGDFSKQVNGLAEKIIALRIYVEAAIDFPEEEIDFLSDGKVAEKIYTIINDFQELSKKVTLGALINEGLKVAIVGQPNAGKSSLFNALSAQDLAIVTDVAGTTRDLIKQSIQIDGLVCHLIDTAGLRDDPDPIEKIGIQKAKDELKLADFILCVIDGSSHKNITAIEQDILTTYPQKTLLVINKLDLIDNKNIKLHHNQVYISAKNQENFSQMFEKIKQFANFQDNSQTEFLAKRRHQIALDKSFEYVSLAKDELETNKAGELVAENLKIAADYLGEITGKVSSDDLLGKIFSQFCIGK